MVSRIIKTVATISIALLALAGCTGASGSGPETIRNFDIHYTISSDGTVHAVETLDYDFAGAQDKHGIDRYLASRFDTTAPGQQRVYRYTNIEVSSPTGASALFSTSLSNALHIRVGNKHATVSGQHTYIIEYDIEGALNRATQPDGSLADEFHWNATGHYWDPSIHQVAIAVDGPAPVDWVTCFAGVEGTQDPCAEAEENGSAANFTATNLTTRQGVTITVAWPEGTFAKTDPILEPSLSPDAAPIVGGSNDGPNPFWNPLHWGTGLAALAGIPLTLFLLIGRRRDRMFAGVTPGQIPEDPDNARVVKAPKDATIIVQYQPPKGLPVGAASALLNKRRKNSDITATLIDLAVRGHLRIEETESQGWGKSKDFTLVATPERAAEKKAKSWPGGPDAAELLPFETTLLDQLFGTTRTSVTLSSLKNTFASKMRKIVKKLDTWIAQRKYFIDKLGYNHPLITWGLVIGFGGFVVSILLGGLGALIAVGIFAGSAISLTFASKAVRRSALGHATYLQVAGFKEYIATAEADRIRFDEDEDVFSRYMPWAMVFGEAERWSKVFAELVAQGKVQPEPDWYVGTSAFYAGGMAGTVASIGSIGSAVDSFTSMATSSFTSTPGSSGGSGGGGSSGGGGGGGGGGSW